ncbi:serine/threonine-protein kinase [Nocardioides jiangxiensis]|uniref:non-specific serine/threonine protein kinase n=1 Tax=Nocardioides jiangxiensis TaxID=3064524 RepID=A0ABT9B0Y6_9ACTN|nr:serine/threonine-protein kinase [Nocardioides sp. WY-20]MDO7868405.1 serine/threonine-protein kinase [Nocardioides sp. WY-20]
MGRLPVVGETFGRYRLLELLGEGGMGVVHVAHDEQLNRKVALKLVLPRHAADPEFRSRFAREAEAQARLESSHVVRVYDYGEHDGVLFLCTQYVEGGDLAAQVAAAGPLAPALAVDLTQQVLSGLEEAHQAGVVHRDVKPANVLLRRRGEGVQAYLCDFGIATMAGQGLTRTGQVIGSLPWMAPERHYGTEPGEVGDVYSAGCVLWFALTGSAPYVGSDGEVMMGHIEGPVPQLPGRSAFVRRANAVLVKALAKHPQDRYPSAAAMAADLRGLAAIAPGAIRLADATVIRPVATTPATAPRTVPRRAAVLRRHWLLPAVATVSLLAAVAGGLAVRSFVEDDPQLAAGATRVDLGGRTVTLQPRRTLSPVPATHTRHEGGAARDVAGSIAGPAPVVGDVEVAGSAGGSGGGARSVPTGAAAPVDRYRCWNGSTAVTLGDCGWPTGVAGATWMVDNVGSCYHATPNDPRVPNDDSWGCHVSGLSTTIYVDRATSVSAARSYLLSAIKDPDKSWAWSDGWQFSSNATDSSPRWRFGRYWQGPDGAAWFIYVSTTTAAERDDAVNAVKYHCRPRSDIQGVPL